MPRLFQRKNSQASAESGGKRSFSSFRSHERTGSVPEVPAGAAATPPGLRGVSFDHQRATHLSFPIYDGTEDPHAFPKYPMPTNIGVESSVLQQLKKKEDPETEAKMEEMIHMMRFLHHAWHPGAQFRYRWVKTSGVKLRDNESPRKISLLAFCHETRANYAPAAATERQIRQGEVHSESTYDPHATYLDLLSRFLEWIVGEVSKCGEQACADFCRLFPSAMKAVRVSKPTNEAVTPRVEGGEVVIPFPTVAAAAAERNMTQWADELVVARGLIEELKEAAAFHVLNGSPSAQVTVYATARLEATGWVAIAHVNVGSTSWRFASRSTSDRVEALKDLLAWFERKWNGFDSDEVRRGMR